MNQPIYEDFHDSQPLVQINSQIHSLEISLCKDYISEQFIHLLSVTYKAIDEANLALDKYKTYMQLRRMM